MIDKKSIAQEWIIQKKKEYKKDPSLIESMIYALYLLEQLCIVGLDFIFKGGTSLILLMKEPKRFSVDIDIIIEPRINRIELERFLSKIVGSSEFLRMELDEKRSYQGIIPKAHYKFIYISNLPNKNKEGKVISNPEREILLDVVFADNHYPVIVNKAIETGWLQQTGNPITVKTPDINSILGDKLTAFAPNTTGVPYNIAKEKEILKQLFDIGSLFDLLTDIEVFKKSFNESAKVEISYRPEMEIKSIEQVLNDIIETSLLIARGDTLSTGEEIKKYNEIKTGIKQFEHFVFNGKFYIDNAQVASAKAAYLAAIILKDYKGKLKYFSKEIQREEYLIENKEYNYLNKRLKFVEGGEALYYWFETIKLLSQ